MKYDVNRMFGMQEKVVVITGGTKGIGREAAIALMHMGAASVVWGSTQDSVAAATEALSGEPGSFTAMQVDVSDEAQVAAATRQVMDRFGRIDGLVNSAGTTHIQSLEDFDMARFERVLRVNVTGTMHCCKHIGGIMKRQGQGSIVNVSSVRGFQGKDKYSAYAASKGAVNNLTHTLGVELAPAGVRVNAIAPCFIKTDISEAVLKDEAFMQWALGRLPVGRLGELPDCVAPILFFLSDGSAFVTGTILPVDGGWLAG